MTRPAALCVPHFGLLLAALALLAFPLAAESSEEATALLAELSAAGKAKDTSGATAALGKVVAVLRTLL